MFYSLARGKSDYYDDLQECMRHEIVHSNSRQEGIRSIIAALRITHTHNDNNIIILLQAQLLHNDNNIISMTIVLIQDQLLELSPIHIHVTLYQCCK